MGRLCGLGARGEKMGEVVGESLAERHHGEGGVGAAAGGEDGAAGDVEIAEAVYGEVAVDDAVGGVLPHAQAAHGVVGVEQGRLGVVEDGLAPVLGVNVRGFEVVLDEIGEACGGVFFCFAELPVDDGNGEAEGVCGGVREADAVVGVGRLLDVDVEAEFGALADGSPFLEARVEEETGDVAEAAEEREEVGAYGLLDLAALEGAEQVADGGGAGVFGLEDDDVGHDGEEARARAELGRGFELRGVDGAVGIEGAEEVDGLLAARRDELRGVVGDVVVEIAANLIVRVGDVGRAEEEARAFDGACAEDEVTGAEGELGLAVVADADGFDALRVGRRRGKREGVGVREDGDLRLGEGFGAYGLGKVAFLEGGPLCEADDDVRSGGRFALTERGEEVGGEGEVIDAEDVFDLLVVRGELGIFDGPGEGGDAGWGGEDVGREGEDLAAPAGGGAAKGAEATVVGAAVVLGRHFGAIKGLAALFELEATSFEEVDVDAAVGETCGEEEPRDATADDANGGLEGLAGGSLVEVDVHVSARLGERWGCPSGEACFGTS